jgi:hypothetical protein
MRRRDLLAGAALAPFAAVPEKGERPFQDASVRVLNPRGRAPLTFIIDDSTCLVNLAHFCIPQLAEVYPDRYLQDWRKLPREIPDSFVRKFMEWCRGAGIKGKYSIVPYPCTVGWIDREMPGWTRSELQASLKLVRDFVARDWDIHPEMVTHTWGIDTRTGRPYPGRTERNMENTGFSVGRSVDFLADYISYALRLLKNAGLPCEGVTTPGGFGTQVRPQLSQATLQGCRDIYSVDVAHYFRDVYTDSRSVAPRVEYASGLDGDDPRCCVHIIGCTGDWTGNWDGLGDIAVDRFITPDLKGGRLPEVIARGEPAALVCHWAGIYYNGEERGFAAFREVVRRLNLAYDNLIWMKTGEIARYWAAKECTRIERANNAVRLRAPFAAASFTIEIGAPPGAVPRLSLAGRLEPLEEVRDALRLEPGRWMRSEHGIVVCFDLPKGAAEITVS